MRNKKQRIAAMCAVLAKNPNKLYSLNYFQEMFSAAKSSISEDAAVIKQAFEDVGIGRIETVAGAHGGIRYQHAAGGKGTPVERADGKNDGYVAYSAGRLYVYSRSVLYAILCGWHGADHG